MSICDHYKSEYFKQFEAVKYILPTFCRMQYEHQHSNTEQSTENHEVSLAMVPVPHITDKTKGLERLQTTRDDDTCHKNGGEESIFLPMGYHTNHGKKGLPDNFKLGEKRKLQYSTTEDTVSEFNDSKKKRFKSDETQSIHKERNGSFNEFKKPFHFPEKSIYCNPSFKQNVYSTSNGLNGISKDVTGKLGFTFDALPNNISKHLPGLKTRETTASQKETKASNLRKRPVERTTTLPRVGEAESMSHDMKERASFSKVIQEKTSVTSQEFISLDSTKYSFLTQMKKMRERAELPAMPCPFCSESFSKYPDLKHHVQTHKHANISRNGLKQHEQILNETQSAFSTDGNSRLTPMSSVTAAHCPCPPSRVPSNENDSMIRATSVIHFAEKKENAEN